MLDTPQNAEWTMYETCGLERDVSIIKNWLPSISKSPT
jgi:hypothetical protein